MGLSRVLWCALPVLLRMRSNAFVLAALQHLVQALAGLQAAADAAVAVRCTGGSTNGSGADAHQLPVTCLVQGIADLLLVSRRADRPLVSGCAAHELIHHQPMSHVAPSRASGPTLETVTDVWSAVPDALVRECFGKAIVTHNCYC
jgi:hypothetical protein